MIEYRFPVLQNWQKEFRCFGLRVDDCFCIKADMAAPTS